MACIESHHRELSDACNHLWSIDKHRLSAGVDYKINLQHGKKPNHAKDVASERLFTFVSAKALQRPLVRHFIALLDNYERSTGVREVVTRTEVEENEVFLDALMKSDAMKFVYGWLVHKNVFRGDVAAFRQKLDDLWFGVYRRETQGDSCGFEHVFVGEERDGKVIGLHNWIQIYHEERKGLLNYTGYIESKQRDTCRIIPHEHDQLITIQFRWRTELKLTTTSLVGVSPEFEMALYTICFMAGKERNLVQLGPYKCYVNCYSVKQRMQTRIGAAFCENAVVPEQAAIKIQASVRRHQAQKRFRRVNRTL